MPDRGDRSAVRRRREQDGRRAEAVAAAWLRLKGYAILARRMKTRRGEIDLVVRRGKLLAFVEVKARPTLEDGLNAVPAAAWARIGAAATAWSGGRSDISALDWRFDLVVVRPWAPPYHLRDAWRPSI